MKRSIIFALAAAGIALAQPEPKQITISVGGGAGMMQMNPGGTIQGAPYSATVVNESIQTLADGNRIVQRTSGMMARDSEGRTRQDMALPPIGNMSAANAPQLVFIQDPVAKTSYQLNLTDKTAHKMPSRPAEMAIAATALDHAVTQVHAAAGAISSQRIAVASGGVPSGPTFFKAEAIGAEQADVHTDSLGTQTMQGVSAQGVRTTRTIAAGQIGNDKPIEIVTEVWTSPELHTIVYSKRSDPRTGDQTFELTNLVRSEPDASLFSVPGDFKLVEGPEGKGNFIFYRPNE
jgi:hypothetical protein